MSESDEPRRHWQEERKGMNKIRKGDEVVVITGKDKGRRGTVLQVFDDQRVLVEGTNVAKKHQKPNPNMGIQGGIVDREMPLDISNVMLFNPKTKKRIEHHPSWKAPKRKKK